MEVSREVLAAAQQKATGVLRDLFSALNAIEPTKRVGQMVRITCIHVPDRTEELWTGYVKTYRPAEGDGRAVLEIDFPKEGVFAVPDANKAYVSARVLGYVDDVASVFIRQAEIAEAARLAGDELRQLKIALAREREALTLLREENSELVRQLGGRQDAERGVAVADNLNDETVNNALLYGELTRVTRTLFQVVGTTPNPTDPSTWKLTKNPGEYSVGRSSLLRDIRDYYEKQARDSGEKAWKEADEAERRRLFRIVAAYLDLRNSLRADEEARTAVANMDFMLTATLLMGTMPKAQRAAMEKQLDQEQIPDRLKALMQRSSDEVTVRAITARAISNVGGSGGGTTASGSTTRR